MDSEGIQFFFGFFDCNGAHRFEPETWTSFGVPGTSVPMYDADNEYLKSIYDKEVDMGMEWLVFHFIKKITSKHRVKLIDLLSGLQYKDTPCVGPATDFHSYTWQESIASTYMAMEQHCTLMEKSPTPRYFWWDIFCQNQHNPGDAGKTFSDTIAQIRCLAFSTPNFMDAKALGRVWCQYELANAVMKGKQIQIVAGTYGDAEEWCMSGKDPLDSWVPVDQAQAKYMEDKDMVLKLVNENIEGGQETLNLMVREKYIKQALGYRLWYICEYNYHDGDLVNQLKKLIADGAYANFTNGYHTALDSLEHYDHDGVPILLAVGAKHHDGIVAELF